VNLLDRCDALVDSILHKILELFQIIHCPSLSALLMMHLMDRVRRITF
jgi:hypothetical protein